MLQPVAMAKGDKIRNLAKTTPSGTLTKKCEAERQQLLCSMLSDVENGEVAVATN